MLTSYLLGEEEFYGALGHRWRNNVFDCPAYELKSPTFGVMMAYTPTTNGFTPKRIAGNAELNDPRNNSRRVAEVTDTTALLFDGSMAADPRLAFLNAFPSTTIGGVYWYGYLWNEAPLYSWSDWPLRHNASLNWLFGDGHAETRPWQPTNATDGTAEFNNLWQLQ